MNKVKIILKQCSCQVKSLNSEYQKMKEKKSLKLFDP